MTASKTVTPKKGSSAPQDAIAMLKADHEAVSQMFVAYKKTRSVAKKKTLVAEICTALKDKLLVPEATVEHNGVRDLIAQLEGIEPDGEMYDAKVKVLSEYVKHHVKEEQNEMFPKAKASSLDMVKLGARMGARKEDLLAQATAQKEETS